MLRAAEQDGHCFLPRAELLPRAARLLELPPDAVERPPSRTPSLVLDGADRVLEPRMDRTEHRLAERVRELACRAAALEVDVPDEPPGRRGRPRPRRSGARCSRPPSTG